MDRKAAEMLLRQMLYRCEIRFLPIIAGFWLRIDPLPDYEELIRILCEKMLDRRILTKYFTSPEGKTLAPAVMHLIRNAGADTTDAIEELFGPLRFAGIDRIRREKYWKDPVSVTEKLWYRGVIFRENRFISGELKECYILPDDLKTVLSVILASGDSPITPPAVPFVIRPASPAEAQTADPPDLKLPDILTIAAALQRDGREMSFPGIPVPVEYLRFLDFLLQESGMFTDAGEADAECIRNFLTKNRTAARLDLIRAWRYAGSYDELSQDSPHLTVETAPVFDPCIAREFILCLLAETEPDTWWSLSGFVAAVKRDHPMFLRRTFSDSPFRIFDTEGNDLRGIGSWFQLEGTYLEFLITGPLKWLGIVRTASENGEPTAFRISREGLFYLLESKSGSVSDAILNKPNLEHDTPHISADGAIACTNKVPRYFRYMAARCCEIEKLYDDRVLFRLTPVSLSRAEKSGISGEAFLKILRRFSGKALPPSLERMLSIDGKTKLPAMIYNATILTVPDALILEDLSESAKAGKWIIQKINSNSILIDPRGIDEIRRFLMEKEIFVDIRIPRS